MKTKLLLLSCVGAFVLLGCASAGTYTTAHAIGKGNFQFALEPSAMNMTIPASSSTAGIGASITIPRLDLAGRYGITDTAEIGARLGAGGLEILSKFQLTEPGKRDLVMSLAPSIGGAFGSAGAGEVSSSFTYLNLSVPFLLGIGVGQHQLILGPRLSNALYMSSTSAGSAGASSTADIISIGTSVGFALKLGESFRLIPEIALSYPALTLAGASAGGQSVSGSGSNGVGVFFLQFGLGIVFGQGDGSGGAADAAPM